MSKNENEFKRRLDAKKCVDEDRDEFGYSIDEEDVAEVLNEDQS